MNTTTEYGNRFVKILVSSAVLLLLMFQPAAGLLGASNSGPQAATMAPPAGTDDLAEKLGIHFVSGSTTTVVIERDGKSYLIDLSERTIQSQPASADLAATQALRVAPVANSGADSGAEVFAKNCADCHGADGGGNTAMKTPNFRDPAVQSGLPAETANKLIREGKSGTAMPAWEGKLSGSEIVAVTSFVKSLGNASVAATLNAEAKNIQNAKAYRPADDYLFSLPTGRPIDRHGLYLNFTHRFVGTPTFSGAGNGDTLFGLDDFSISSFGLRYGVTNKLSISAYRSPSLILRPIELGSAYRFMDEHHGDVLNATVRLSIDGQNDFSKNFTENLELLVSRSVSRRAQLYLVPTLNIQNRELIAKPGSLASVPPNLPGFNTFSLGVGGAFDIRPSVALVAEAMPTLVNGPELGIHRPAFAFGIQKRVLHHAFTLGFTNSPGTIVSQRAGTRATFLNEPSADTPGGLFIGFDLMRQIY
jgi:mono/diheme cytochrome c family protein